MDCPELEEAMQDGTASLCQHKTVLPQDGIGEGESIKCHRDGVGEFELLMGETVAAVMVLCEQHRDQFEDTFTEVKLVT